MAVNVQKLRERFRALQEERNPFEAVYKHLVDYILPTAGRFDNSASRPDTDMYDLIFDATATDAVGVLAAGMLSGMTSPARPWFRLTTGDRKLDERADVKRWLADSTEAMQRVFLQSNVYQALEQCYRELGVFGTACMVALPSKRDVIHLHFMTVGEYWIAEDYEQRVNTLFRRFNMTAEQMVTEFGEDKVSLTVREAYNTPRNRYKQFSVIHAIYPRGDYIKGSILNTEMPYASVYFEETTKDIDGSDSILLEEGFRHFPGLCPRWELHGGNTYGTSPGMKALRPVMGLQVEVKRKGQGIDYQTNPPMLYPDTMEDRQSDFAPGGISYYAAGTTPQQAVPAVQATMNLQYLTADITEVQRRIDSFFYKDLFTAIMSTPRTNRTAYEVDQIAQERMALLGPVLQRLNAELLDPLIAATYDCMVEAGLIDPAPQGVEGISVTFESILVQALRSAGITAEDRFLTTVQALAALDPTVVDNVDFDVVIQNRGTDQGVDPRIMRSPDEVAKIRESRMQAQQQQAQMAQAQQMADVAGTLAKVNPDITRATDITALQGY